MFFGCPQKLQQDSTETPTKFHGQKWFPLDGVFDGHNLAGA